MSEQEDRWLPAALDRAHQREAVEDYLAAHPSLVDLDSESAVEGLAAALERQHEQFLEQPESFESRAAIARAILAAWLATLRAEGSR